MAIGDDTDEGEDEILVPLSRDLAERLNTARGEQSFSEYVETVLQRATERTKTGLDEDELETSEERLVSEPGEAETAREFEVFWHAQMRTVFAWLWVGAVALYGAGDVISTSFVLRTNGGYEANPFISGLIDISPWFLLVWKLVALLLLFYLSDYLLRKANHTRIPWLSLVIPGFLVVWGSFITGMNIMNIPSEVRLLAAASVFFAVATTIIGYLLFEMVYRDFVENQGEDYPGMWQVPKQTLSRWLHVQEIKRDGVATKAAITTVYPLLVAVVGAIIWLLSEVLPGDSTMVDILTRPTRYADLLLVVTAIVVLGTAWHFVATWIDSPWATTSTRIVRGTLAALTIAAIMVGGLFLLAITSGEGTMFVQQFEIAWYDFVGWLADLIGPVAAIGDAYFQNSPIGLSLAEAALVAIAGGVAATLALILQVRARISRSGGL